MLDVTPFGFTPTESLVYSVLLRLGPSTGYAVARAGRLARANAYSALEGLVTRGAASRTPSPARPVRDRPTDPQALVVQPAPLQGEGLGSPHPVSWMSGRRALQTMSGGRAPRGPCSWWLPRAGPPPSRRRNAPPPGRRSARDIEASMAPACASSIPEMARPSFSSTA